MQGSVQRGGGRPCRLEKEQMADIVIAALAYIVPTFPLAYAWHLTLFKARYDALKLYRSGVVPLFGLASMVIQGILFGAIYVGLVQPMPVGWLAKAGTYAALGGFLSWSFTTVAAAAKNPMTSVTRFVGIETAFTVIQWIIVGVITALLLP
jgi:hypothetical protein